MKRPLMQFTLAVALLANSCTKDETPARREWTFRRSLVSEIPGCYTIAEAIGMSADDSVMTMHLNPIVLDTTVGALLMANSRLLKFNDVDPGWVGYWGVDSLTDSLLWVFTSGLATVSMNGVLHDSIYSARVGSGSDITPYEAIGTLRAIRRPCLPRPVPHFPK
jgi:hypothetical protein